MSVRRARVTLTGAVLAGVITALTLAAAPALADSEPHAATPDGTRLVSSAPAGRQQVSLVVHSASMNRDIPLSVLLPADTSRPHPTLYLLNGAGGGEDAATWRKRTDVVQFFADKNVNVVTPELGAYSYYTDWVSDDPTRGRNKWSTFLGTELPPIIDKTLATNGRNAVAGISTSATAVLNLVVDHPGRFQAVGSYSGCASVTSPQGEAYVRAVVGGRGNADPQNMWGPYGSAGWRDHDPVLNAARLRGPTYWISAATGLPGRYDTPTATTDLGDLVDQVVLGGIIEAATNACTHQLQGRMNTLGIPATFDYPVTGTHSWLYWRDQLHRSWPKLGAAIGA
ncbi:alpha/beta hydrolase [Williamsia sterculiae]|uniref:alpha/beta hydrolase n=1 Tax=Williamsia sterculiae TaxID=1344003 RepID=UPI001F381191|nr:alpha/beta hydrolase family protein [Williamsia sterculiae]